MEKFRSFRFLGGMCIVVAGVWLTAETAAACGGRHGHHGGSDSWTWGAPRSGPSYDGPPVYGNGLIGPPTQACAEKMQMEANLQQLFTIRAQVQAGKKIVTAGAGGQPRVYSTHKYRKALHDYATGGEDVSDGTIADIAEAQQQMNAARDQGLAIVDMRISSTQDRVSQLQYECPD